MALQSINRLPREILDAIKIQSSARHCGGDGGGSYCGDTTKSIHCTALSTRVHTRL